jgi:hypothetical protein
MAVVFKARRDGLRARGGWGAGVRTERSTVLERFILERFILASFVETVVESLAGTFVTEFSKRNFLLRNSSAPLLLGPSDTSARRTALNRAYSFPLLASLQRLR